MCLLNSIFCHQTCSKKTDWALLLLYSNDSRFILIYQSIRIGICIILNIWCDMLLLIPASGIALIAVWCWLWPSHLVLATAAVVWLSVFAGCRLLVFLRIFWWLRKSGRSGTWTCWQSEWMWRLLPWRLLLNWWIPCSNFAWCWSNKPRGAGPCLDHQLQGVCRRQTSMQPP